MGTQYEAAPGRLFYMGERFVCPCGVNDFKVEIGAPSPRFWCDCGEMYTEQIVNALCRERAETAASGE